MVKWQVKNELVYGRAFNYLTDGCELKFGVHADAHIGHGF
jgi:hypothetical protein